MPEFKFEIGDIVKEPDSEIEMKVFKRLTNMAFVIQGMLKNPKKDVDLEEIAAVSCEWYVNAKRHWGNFEDSKLILVKKRD